MRFLFILLVAALLSFPVVAQEYETPDTPTPTVEPTPNNDIVVESGDTTVTIPQDDIETAQNIWQAVFGFGMVFLAGLGTGSVGAAVILRGIRDNAPMIRAMELLYESQPVDRKEKLRNIAEGLNEAAKTLDEVTDGIPAEDKTT